MTDTLNRKKRSSSFFARNVPKDQLCCHENGTYGIWVLFGDYTREDQMKKNQDGFGTTSKEAPGTNPLTNVPFLSTNL